MLQLIRSFMLFLLLFSGLCKAEFELTGPVKLTLADGSSQQTEFGFAFLKQQEGFEFRLGSHRMAVDEVPKRYTLAMMLNTEQQVWVRDFSKVPVIGFEWQIGNHHLKLFKQVMQPARPGDFVLLIDDMRYHFVTGRPAQIHFYFDDKGISEIEIEAMLQPKR